MVAMAYDGEAHAMNKAEGGLDVSMCFPQVMQALK
jgi:hypothetical protein